MEDLGGCRSVTDPNAMPPGEVTFGGMGDGCDGVTQLCEEPFVCSQSICLESSFTTTSPGSVCDVLQGGPTGCGVGNACRITITADPDGMPIFTGNCGAPGASGEPCLVTLECGPNLRCVGANPDAARQGSCQALAGVGEACGTDFECASGRCAPLGDQGQCATRSTCNVPDPT